jgi:hypothetical protein
MGDRLRTDESLEALGLAELSAGLEADGRRHLEEGLAVRSTAAIREALQVPRAA